MSGIGAKQTLAEGLLLTQSRTFAAAQDIMHDVAGWRAGSNGAFGTLAIL